MDQLYNVHVILSSPKVKIGRDEEAAAQIGKARN